MAAKKLATVDDLLALSEDLRVELVNGEIVEKSAPSFEHSSVQASLTVELGGRFGKSGSGPGGWWIVTEVDTEYEKHQLFLHDIAGWKRDRVKEKPKGRPVKIRPDWVCEILSPSNWRRDTATKFHILRKHEVAHYWIVDPDHQELTVYRWSKDGYVVTARVGPGEKAILEPFENVELDVSSLFGIEFQK